MNLELLECIIIESITQKPKFVEDLHLFHVCAVFGLCKYDNISAFVDSTLSLPLSGYVDTYVVNFISKILSTDRLRYTSQSLRLMVNPPDLRAFVCLVQKVEIFVTPYLWRASFPRILYQGSERRDYPDSESYGPHIRLVLP